MRRGKKGGGHEEGFNEAWLLPYSDLMTLLLAVFIVLFCVSAVNTSKAKALSEAFRNSFMTGSPNILDSGGQDATDRIEDIPNLVPTEGEQGQSTQTSTVTTAQDQTIYDTVESTLKTYFGDQVATSNNTGGASSGDSTGSSNSMIQIKQTSQGLVITMSSGILFPSGSADLTSTARDELNQIGEALSNVPSSNYIRIEGHTDNAPISTAQYPSNWYLSVARAASVAQLFVDQGYVDPANIVAMGYGDTRPVADNSTADGRAQNRRVDIVILNAQYSALENPMGADAANGDGTAGMSAAQVVDQRAVVPAAPSPAPAQ